MIKVAICDDDKEFRKNMHSIVEKHFLTKERSVWIVEFKNGNAKGTGHVCFTTACSAGDKKISVFRYIFASCKSVNEILVKLASGSVIDIYNICFRLVESSIMD